VYSDPLSSLPGGSGPIEALRASCCYLSAAVAAMMQRDWPRLRLPLALGSARAD